MTAWQRSNIVERHEKGIGSVSFKRLLAAGLAGALVALIGGRMVGFFPACLSAGLVLAGVLIITHPLEGMPLFVFGLRSLRGLLTVAAARRESEPLSLAGHALRVSPEEGILRADTVYDAEWEDGQQADLLDADWEYLGGFGDAGGEGLSAAENPFRKGDA